MWKKLSGFGGLGKGDKSSRFKFDVEVISVDGVPDAVRRCCVVMARGSRADSTDVRDTRRGSASFNRQRLTLNAGLRKDKDGEYQSKEFVFKVQMPRAGTEELITIAKENVDMSDFIDEDGPGDYMEKTISVMFKVGSGSKGAIRVRIAASPTTGAASDSGTELSRLSAGHGSEAGSQDFGVEAKSAVMKSLSKRRAQDLQDDGASASSEQTRAHSKDRDAGSGAKARAMRGMREQLPSTREEEDDDDDELMDAELEDDGAFAAKLQQRGAAIGAESKLGARKAALAAGAMAAADSAAGVVGTAKGATSKAAAAGAAKGIRDAAGDAGEDFGKKKAPAKKKKAFDDDENISPVEEDEPADRWQGRSAAAAAPAASTSTPAATTKGMSGSSNVTLGLGSAGLGDWAAKGKGLMGRLTKVVKKDDSTAAAAATAVPTSLTPSPEAVRKKVEVSKEEAHEEFLSNKAALFGTAPKETKKASGGAASSNKGKGAAKAGAAGDDNEANRSALFGTPASTKKANVEGRAKAAAETDEEEDGEDEEASRAQLFGTTARRAGATAGTGFDKKKGPGAGKAKVAVEAPDPGASDDDGQQRLPHGASATVIDASAAFTAVAGAPPSAAAMPPRPPGALPAVAVYDYEGRPDYGEVSVSVHDRIWLLVHHDDGWLEVRNKAGEDGYIPDWAATVVEEEPEPVPEPQPELKLVQEQLKPQAGTGLGNKGQEGVTARPAGASEEKEELEEEDDEGLGFSRRPAAAGQSLAGRRGERGVTSESVASSSDAGRLQGRGPGTASGAAAGARRTGSRRARHKQDDQDEDKDEEGSAFGQRAGAGIAGQGGKSGALQEEEADGDADTWQDTAGRRKAAAVAAATTAAAAAGAVQSEVQKLQAELKAAALREKELRDAMDIDPMDLVAQLQEMEQEHIKAMEAAEKQHTQSLAAAEKVHKEQLEELQRQLEELAEQLAAAEAAAAKGKGRRGASAEVEKREAAVAEREAALDDREAAVEEREAAAEEREAAVGDREAAVQEQEAAAGGRSLQALSEENAKLQKDLAAVQAKLSEANKMVDDSMVHAVKQSQEKKQMSEEIDRLRGLLADAGISATALPATTRRGRGTVPPAPASEASTADYEDDRSSGRGVGGRNGGTGRDRSFANGTGGTDAAVQLEKLRVQVIQLQQENQELQKQVKAVRTGRARGGGSEDEDDEELVSGGVAARRAAREKAQLQRELGKIQAENVELAAKVEKLEGMLEGWEVEVEAAKQLTAQLEAQVAELQAELEAARKQAARRPDPELDAAKRQVAELESELEQLQQELEAAQEEAQTAKAEAAKAAAAGNSRKDAAQYRRDLQELQEHVAELEQSQQALSEEKAALQATLDQERGAREESERRLQQQAAAGARPAGGEAEGDAAHMTAKYNKLREKFKLLQQSSQEELDDLADSLDAAEQRVQELEAQVQDLQKQLASRPAGRGGGGLGNPEVEALLRSENERMVLDLVDKQLELARLNEEEAMLKRELVRAKEVNSKLATRLTELEQELAAAGGGVGAGGGPPKPTGRSFLRRDG